MNRIANQKFKRDDLVFQFQKRFQPATNFFNQKLNRRENVPNILKCNSKSEWADSVANPDPRAKMLD